MSHMVRIKRHCIDGPKEISYERALNPFFIHASMVRNLALVHFVRFAAASTFASIRSKSARSNNRPLATTARIFCVL